MTGGRILRYTAFSTSPAGGNPAGVVLDAAALSDREMQAIATDVDYAETAFVTGTTSDGAAAIRYFSPIAEVPFCGHATVATAVALVDHGRAQPDSTVVFATPVGSVEIRVTRDATGASAAFTSVAPSVRALAGRDLAAILDLLGLSNAELDPALPPRIADAGNPHPVIAIAAGEAFDTFRFDPAAVRALMDDRGWPATITVVHRMGEHTERIVELGAIPSTGT